MVKRAFDLIFALFAAIALLIPALCIALMVRMTSKGAAVFWSERGGQHGRTFWMPKFRTMRRDTPLSSAHELANPQQYVTPLGRFLRRTSMDEIPQLWCVIKGEMSLVGPRPLILLEDAILTKRDRMGVGALRPGITGWAQVNGRTGISNTEKIALDAEYLVRQSFGFDLYILYRTVLVVFLGRGIIH